MLEVAHGKAAIFSTKAQQDEPAIFNIYLTGRFRQIFWLCGVFCFM